jgi:hypothetical protein
MLHPCYLMFFCKGSWVLNDPFLYRMTLFIHVWEGCSMGSSGSDTDDQGLIRCGSDSIRAESDPRSSEARSHIFDWLHHLGWHPSSFTSPPAEPSQTLQICNLRNTDNTRNSHPWSPNRSIKDSSNRTFRSEIAPLNSSKTVSNLAEGIWLARKLIKILYWTQNFRVFFFWFDW